MLKRSLQDAIEELALARHKMAFISGPRQCGTTTLSKQLLIDNDLYFNWDTLKFRKIWNSSPETLAHQALRHPKPRIILDEVHKHKFWKRMLKGFFDEFGAKIQILVTGSARLNIYRKGGDSLLGRYISFRLHPFSLSEAAFSGPLTIERFVACLADGFPVLPQGNKDSADIQDKLFRFGGFPEPFLHQDEALHRIWQRSRVEKIIREDLRDLSKLPELSQIEVLAALLPDRVGSPLSISSLREDLEVAHTTVTRWLNYLEQLFYFFQIRPYSSKISRSLKREAKIYLYDWSEVENPGPRFENMIACHLLKGCHFWTDIGAANLDLFYLRNKEKQEVDFLITKNKKPWFTVEAKFADLNLDLSFKNFQKVLQVPHFQIVAASDIQRSFLTPTGPANVIGFNQFFLHWP
jgi:predicted AAA+ superfamily ATPase